MDPFPVGEFRVGGVDVDVGVAADEGEREPFLRLATPASLPQPPRIAFWQVVSEPAAAFTQQQGLGGADFLLELAVGRLDRRLARVDAALRHLPGGSGAVFALADEDAPIRSDQHQPDIRSIALGNTVDHWRNCDCRRLTRMMQAWRHSK